MDAPSRATLSFSGTGVSWIGYMGNATGIARVYLDGVLADTVDTSSSTEQPQAVIYTRTGLPPGAHTLAIEVTHDYNHSVSCCAWIVFDAFDVYP